jgi:hypothetical protein
MAKFDEGPLTSGLFVFGTRVKVKQPGRRALQDFAMFNTAPQRAELKLSNTSSPEEIPSQFILT